MLLKAFKPKRPFEPLRLIFRFVHQFLYLHAVQYHLLTNSRAYSLSVSSTVETAH